MRPRLRHLTRRINLVSRLRRFLSSNLNTSEGNLLKRRFVYGEFTYGVENANLRFPEQGVLIVGKYCQIADNLQVFLGGNHRLDLISTFPFGHIFNENFNFKVQEHPVTNGNVVIGNDVWIGSGVSIMSGVKIGSGSVIAANSHVVNDVEPYAIVGGNPATKIRFRIDEELIGRTLALEWWDWCTCRINRYQEFFLKKFNLNILASLEEAKIQEINHSIGCAKHN